MKLSLATLVTLTALSFAPPAGAGTATVLREAAEQAWKGATRRGAAESAEAAARQSARLASRFGDDGLAALRRLGPRSERLIEEAGDHASTAARLLGSHGEDAVRVVTNKHQLALVAAHGDAVATALLRHGAIAEPLIGTGGQAAARAVGQLSSRNARRLAMLADDNVLQHPELLDVLARYGDRAMDFVWRHKGALAVGSTLAVFVADPEPFLSGAAELSAEIAEHGLRPLAEVPSVIASHVNWTLLAAIGLAALGAWQYLVRRRRRSPAATKGASPLEREPSSRNAHPMRHRA